MPFLSSATPRGRFFPFDVHLATHSKPTYIKWVLPLRRPQSCGASESLVIGEWVAKAPGPVLAYQKSLGLRLGSAANRLFAASVQRTQILDMWFAASVRTRSNSRSSIVAAAATTVAWPLGVGQDFDLFSANFDPANFDPERQILTKF